MERTQSRVVVVQPAAICDHVALMDAEGLTRVLGQEAVTGGSQRINEDDLRTLLAALGDFHTRAGGSASNVARALAAGFSIHVQLATTRGTDEWGAIFMSSLNRAGVITKYLKAQAGPTGRSVILTCESQRTMRTCINPEMMLRPSALQPAAFDSCTHCFLSAYCSYSPGLLQHAAQQAQQAGVKVVLDMASFEVVHAYHAQLMELLKGGLVHAVICNEVFLDWMQDEAQALVEGASTSAPSDMDDADALPMHVRALRLLLAPGRAQVAVVTRGSAGCAVASVADPIHVEVPGVQGISAVDASGAGDHFSAAFMYGLCEQLPLERCAQIGCLAGAAAVRVVGTELSSSDWMWFHQRVNGQLAGSVVEAHAELYDELLKCYALIERHGRGVVYFGSARLGTESPFWERSWALARDVAGLLGSTTWTGGGPGMMRSAIEGAVAGGGHAAAIRIGREAGQGLDGQAQPSTARVADYLPPGHAYVCKYMPSRKVALTDAGIRQAAAQRTAFIVLPGGLGTMDELFSILTLVQLGKLGSKLATPIVVVNYDGFYDGLIDLLRSFDRSRALAASELEQTMVATCNDDVVSYLARFYNLEVPGSMQPGHAVSAMSVLQQPQS